jgi:beta-glucosidase
MALPRRALLSAAAAAPAGLLLHPDPPPADPATLRFPPGFAFGVSSSAYQIEGAVRADGRGDSIWDEFCHHPGHVKAGQTADVAADHYHRMPEDVALLAGIPNYRFSVSWPRLFPNGDLTANPKGFAFYDQLLDTLHANGITPWLTLYHWDLPQALQAKGGWTNRDTASRFADFAGAMARHFGDRVPNWLVMNEISVHAYVGHCLGDHAPGLTGAENWFAALHHLNLGQGLAVQALRAGSKGRVGTVAACEPILPSSASPDDIAAAARFDAAWNGGVLSPLLLGRYPEAIAACTAPHEQTGDAALVAQKLDMLGINYYSRLHIQHNQAWPLSAYFGPSTRRSPYYAGGWPIEPDGLYEILTRIQRDYNPPEMFISENGYATASDDPRGEPLNDIARISYIAQHLRFLHQARADGVKVNGYFAWSLLDSFEWNDGMQWRFGLVAVDFATLARTPKRSLGWYKALAA